MALSLSPWHGGSCVASRLGLGCNGILMWEVVEVNDTTQLKNARALAVAGDYAYLTANCRLAVVNPE